MNGACLGDGLDAGLGGARKSADAFNRTRSAEETLARVSPHMHAFGVSRLADVTGLDRIGIPVVLSIRPESRSVSVSHGKGITPAAARASALMEAVELWHSETADLPLRAGTALALRERQAILDLERLPLHTDFRQAEATRLLWVEARDLMSGQPVLAPHQLVHLDMSLPALPGREVFFFSSNGLASGNHILEAACHGLCELIERDALSVWHAAPRVRQAMTRIELDSISHETSRSLLHRIVSAGLDVAVWDVSSDFGIACFLCLIHESNGHLGLGSSAHLDPGVALAGALAEAAQTRMTYITGSRDDLDESEFTDAGRAAKQAMAADLLALGSPKRNFGQTPAIRHATFREDLDWMLGSLDRNGIRQVALVDLTREPWSIPVVRVIVPGLEAPHDEDGYTPGPRARAAR